MSFRASTRVYILREKPQTQGSKAPGELKAGEDEELKGLLGLPEEPDRRLCLVLLVLSGALKKVWIERKPKLLNVSSFKLPTHLQKKHCISWDLTKLQIDSCRGINNV